MHRHALALVAGCLALAACSQKDIGIPDFPLGVPAKQEDIIAKPKPGDPSLMDTHLHKRPKPKQPDAAPSEVLRPSLWP